MPFEWSEYERLAEAMASAKGKVMLSINDHPDIRARFADFHLLELDIKYSVGNRLNDVKTSQELVITNWNTNAFESLF